MTSTADASRLGAVIVHFHRERDAARLVQDLVTHQGVPGRNIVVVDNGSTGDRLLQELADRSVTPTVERLDNVGYAAGMNHGVRCLPDSVDIVLMLTHEVVLGAGCVDRLSTVLAADPRIGAVGPLLLSGPASVWSAGGELSQMRHLPHHRDLTLGPNEGPNHHPSECAWLDGAVVMVDRVALSEIGGLDERFFLYAEDVDLGLRLNRHGHLVVVVPDARASQSPSGDIDPFLWTRNTFLLLRAHTF